VSGERLERRGEDDPLDDDMFALFASVYPHEAHEAWPERFLDYATKRSGQPAAVILQALQETAA
jgi:hypothetical protein